MMTETLSCLLLALAALAPGKDTRSSTRRDSQEAPAIAWSGSWEEAFRRSREENRPVLIAINMDGENANEEMVSQTYHDQKLFHASQKTINLIASAATHPYRLVDDADGSKRKVCTRFGSVSCEEHQKIETIVRREYFQNAEEMIAPQHLTVMPNGGLIRLKQYQVSAGELRKMIQDAVTVVGKPRKAKPQVAQNKKATPEKVSSQE